MVAIRITFSKRASLIFLLALVAASANSQPAPAQDVPGVGGGKSGDSGISTFDNLEIVDASLNAKVTVQRVGSEVGENNLLTVFAGFKNKTGRKLALEVQTIYKDKLGGPLNAGSWIPLTLKPHQENEYRSTAISEEAVDYLVRVRRARNKG